MKDCNFCPHCGKPSGQIMDMEVYDSETGVGYGMFNDGPPLYKYNLKDGRTAYEVVQTVPWSSGPMIFLCLEIDKEKQFLWTEKEIEKY
jgi:hypothetical protein